MSDIVDRMRNLQANGLLHYDHKGPMPSWGEAADEIESLRNQLAEARNGALEEAAKVAEQASEHYVAMAIEALKTQTQEKE